MSIDLIGSTALKHQDGGGRQTGGVDPIWVKQIKHFYADVPSKLKSLYDARILSYHGNDYKKGCPSVWKTIGDEIILCCRVIDLVHLHICISVFTDQLRNYGHFLDNSQIAMDVKGSAWIAAFPIPNITVEIVRLEEVMIGPENPSETTSDEHIEARADESPYRFDFLGTSIDAGFRISKLADREKFVVSIELAYLLSKYAHLTNTVVKMAFLQKKIFKGVLSGMPYPIIAIDAERSPDKRELRSAEESLSTRKSNEPADLYRFLGLFLKDANIEVPYLAFDAQDKSTLEVPTFLKYCDKWIESEEGNAEVSNNITDALTQDGTDNSGNLDSANEFLSRVTENLEDSN